MAAKTEQFEFTLTRPDGSSQNVAVMAVDEAEARSQVAELFPGIAFAETDNS